MIEVSDYLPFKSGEDWDGLEGMGGRLLPSNGFIDGKVVHRRRWFVNISSSGTQLMPALGTSA